MTRKLNLHDRHAIAYNWLLRRIMNENHIKKVERHLEQARKLKTKSDENQNSN